MRVSILLLPMAVIAAEITPITQSVTSIPSLETPSLIQPVETAPISIQTAGPVYSPPSADDISEEELRKRQNAGQVNGALAAATVPTQVSPVTTYLAYGPNGIQTPAVFTQLFSAVPDQWDGPLSGNIGLGSITGQVGIVRTKAKRNFVAAATDAVKNIERRAKAKSASTNGGNGYGTPGKRLVVLTTAFSVIVPFILYTT